MIKTFARKLSPKSNFGSQRIGVSLRNRIEYLFSYRLQFLWELLLSDKRTPFVIEITIPPQLTEPTTKSFTFVGSVISNRYVADCYRRSRQNDIQKKFGLMKEEYFV